MKTIKKHFLSLAILLILVFISGCSSTGSPSETGKVPVVSPDKTQPSQTAPVKTLVIPTSTPTPVTIVGRQDVPLGNYGKITLTTDQLEVSSTNSPDQSKENLVDGISDTYWHNAYPRTSDDTWVIVDLGSAVSLDVLAILPRPVHKQLWTSNDAILEGSNDRQNWEFQYRLELHPGELNDKDWIGFVFSKPTGPFRYYRLFVSDPKFLSMAGFALYGEGGVISYDELSEITGMQNTSLSMYGKITLTAGNIDVSSVNLPSQDKDNIISGLGDPYWHVAVPRTSNDAWVVIDLGTDTTLDALAIRPRLVHPQLWKDDHAILEGSDDGQAWKPQIRLTLIPGELNDQDWIAFIFDRQIGPFRYYRLFISDPDFLSLGGLALYGEGGVTSHDGVWSVTSSLGVNLDAFTKIVLTNDNIEVSSTNLPSQGKENLIDGIGDSYWHIAFPRTSDNAWIMFSFNSPISLDAIAILPRATTPQLWKGDTAILEGSDDGRTWQSLVKLDINLDEINDMDWISFVFPDPTGPFRYFRLFITDSRFLSLGDIAIYGEE